jgi:hypothetical protein
MYNQDLHIIQIKEMKNLLETYVYDNRAYLDTYGDWAIYMEEAAWE